MLTEEAGGRRSSRPPHTTERFAAAVEIASGGSAALRRHARRYSLCAADAEDACQRGLEILLTKAPTADRAQLRAWLLTVIKHEALAVRRQRERAQATGSPEDVEALSGEHGEGPAERASSSERTRRAAEALGHLKQAEVRCMLLKAMGFSYREISQRTGYSHTKVNRCLTEGRRSFLDRFDRISTGAGCAELAPLLSAASDGECPAPDRLRVRAHLEACATCRATLRTYREAPARLAELLPPAALLPVLERAGWWSRLTGWLDTGPAERAAGLAQKLHGNAELLSAKKTAAVVASTAALAGGTAVEHQVSHPRVKDERQAAARETSKPSTVASNAVAPAASGAGTRSTRAAASSRRAGAASAKRRVARTRQGEFSFEASGSSAGSEPAPRAAASGARVQAASEFGGPADGRATGSGAGEFGP